MSQSSWISDLRAAWDLELEMTKRYDHNNKDVIDNDPQYQPIGDMVPFNSPYDPFSTFQENFNIYQIFRKLMFLGSKKEWMEMENNVNAKKVDDDRKPDYWTDASRKLYKLRTLFAQSTSMLFPVFCLSTFVFLYIELLGKPSVECGAAGFYHIVYYVEKPSDPASVKFVGGTIDGVLILLATIVLTALFIVLYMKKKPEIILKVIYGLLTSISFCSMFYFI
jgi:hypothetical protein